MKKKINIKTAILSSLLPALLCSLLIAICSLSCEQPFRAGLGGVIDLQAPVIVLESPGAGAYIRGTTVFMGRASDDYKLDFIGFQISNYPDYDLQGYKTMNHRAGKFYRMADVSGDSRSSLWTFEIDTTEFPDGDFKIKLLAIDSVGKEALTDDIAFYVKNNIPQISLAFPSIVRGTERGDLGGQYLNYNYINNSSERTGIYRRAMDSKALLVGMISDSEGLNRKEGEAEIMDEMGNKVTAELFPPQIRLWEVDFSGVTDPSASKYPPGVLPPENEVPWKKLDIMEIGVNNVQFIYELPNVSGQYFGFEIRAQSSDKVHSVANYPRSWVNWDTGTPEYRNENAYVLIYVREPLEYPMLELWGLEDISNPGNWEPSKNGGKGGYNDINIPEPDKSDGNYPYVDRFMTSKGGPFTLRLRASHSGGIASAKVFWEKESDRTQRGRFIWDPANEPLPGGKGDTVSGRIIDFGRWGRRDFNIDGGGTTSNFVFTYHDDPARDRIPNTDSFYDSIRGRAKVQTYKGPLQNQDGKTFGFDELPEANEQGLSYWEDFWDKDYEERLPDGTYNLSIYTTSSSNTRIAVPFTVTISIDRKTPKIELNDIEGKASEIDRSLLVPVTVNGVIRPRFILSDEGTGFRSSASDYFKRDNGMPGSEQAYILIPAAQKTAMDNYLKNRPWPDFPSIAASGNALNDVAVSKHGPIFNSSCLFKTSNNNSATELPLESDALPDGRYWLYAFARDNAFNVGTISFPIDVNFKSDEPVFNFTVGSINKDVTNPDVDGDYPNSNKGEGFITVNGTRNKFSASSSIRIQITDDDSLDLGTEAAPSSIKVEFIGSTTTGGKTVAHADTDNDYQMELTPEEIKNAFAPQSVVGGARNPVRQITGTISQTVLLNHLKSKDNYNKLFDPNDTKADPEILKQSFSSLPDGIYRVRITVSDYAPAKLVTPETAPAALVKSKTETFWIAVDNKSPIIDPATVRPPSGDFLSIKEEVKLEGVITDQNGPFYVTGYTIFEDRAPVTGSNPPRLDIDLNVPKGSYNPASELWEWKFSFPIKMNGRSGNFTFEVRFQDRFGNSTTLSQRYPVDSKPPTVTLTRPIETFVRDEPDVTLGGAAITSENKRRLAVKVVNFSINALDDNKVEGIRWWLLPANSGQVLDYDAFPAKDLQIQDPTPDKTGKVDRIGTYYSNGDYYNGSTYSTISDKPVGFNDGAYGVVDVENRQFTIFVDTERLSSNKGNGEYRLHIIAMDAAKNISLAVENPASNVYQTVFILQEEDKPYFSSISPASKPDTISVVGDSGLVVRGSLFENNGFGESVIWPGSVMVWFNSDGAAPPAGWEALVESGSDIPGWERKEITAGLGRQGRNLSLAFNLKDYFTIGNDGTKRYIIRAKDSPMNKLRKDGTAAGLNTSGVEAPPADAAVYSVARWKQYEFLYDATPPVIQVTAPATPGMAFGTNINDPSTGFNLGGYIEDANLKTMTNYNKEKDPKYNGTDNRYYFEYTVDNETTRRVFPLSNSKVGNSVTFEIPASVVAATILENKFLTSAFPEGSHTITLFVGDLSGKEASFVYNFIKDVTPPEISFTNFIDGSTVYNAANKSKVAENWWTGMIPAAKLAWLRSNPLTIIYYDPGTKPILQGAIADTVSNINIPTFKYWIDNKAESSLATIDGSGRNVRWTIYLTSDGTVNGTPLPDGVHTIVVNVDDASGAKNDGKHMIAFRIDSKPPAATITVPASSVFGKPDQQPDPVFTITGTASDANLEKLELRIVDKVSGNAISINGNTVITFNTQGAEYIPFGTPSSNPSAEDKVNLTWSQPVTKALYNSMGDGNSYDVKVVASDYYGNKSEEQVWTFTVDKTPPVIEFANPPNSQANNNANLGPSDFIVLSTLAENNRINRLTSENLRIQGKVTDRNAVRALESQVERWNWGTGAWVVLEAWKNVQDLSANRFSEINWTKNLLGQNDGDLNISTAGGATTPEGLYRIQLRAKDESFTQNGTDDWTIATDWGNPVVSGYIYFYYDRTNPELTIDGSMENFYSTLLMQGKFVFSGTVTDNNRFAKIEVKIEPVDTADKYSSTPYRAERTVSITNLNTQPASGRPWNVTFDDSLPKPDGRYRVITTVYDMTGRSSQAIRAFTLDNTPPGAKFTLPAKRTGYRDGNNNIIPLYGNDDDTAPNPKTGFASVIVNGGEGAVITGETWDKSGNNSESGIDQMWFHLGFIDNSAAFPTRAAIEAEEIRIIRAFNPALTEAQVKELSPAARNALMDSVSKYEATGDADGKGNAWFKLGGDEYPRPTGFIINNPNIYDWRMEIPATHPTLGQIGGLKLYGSDITVKGRKYTVGSAAARRMAQVVTGQAGIYRLPLWIRLADKVGNVEYYCHDIWFYPDGDIPTTTIFGADNGTMASARGGAISVDGEARSNTSVFHVAFRVFADNVSNTNLTSAANPTRPNPDSVVLMPNTLYDFVPINSPVYNIIPSEYRTTNLSGTANSRWYYANLMLKGGAGEPLIPWSVILNAEQEISKLIVTKGFISTSGGTANDMIRVWLEVFVFNGEGSPIRSSIYQNDQLNTAGNNLYGTATTPRPYVKAFYIKSAAPQITHPDVGGSWDGSKFVWNAATQDTSDPGTPGYKGAGTEVRRDKFAVRAILDPNPTGNANSGLGEVSVRTRLNNDPYTTWTKVWENGSVLANNPGVKITQRNVAATPARTRYNFEYDIDSKAAGSSAAWAAINNGNWANSGGNFTVQVRIRDNASPPNEAEQTVVIGVDNFAPVADPNYTTNPKVAGTNVDFMGRVFDYAVAPNMSLAGAQSDVMTDIAPRRISRVYAWFTRTEGANERYVNINTGARAASPASGLREMSVLENRAATVTYGSNSDMINTITLTNRGAVNASRRLPNLGSQLAHNADWVREISESTATPGTRMLWSPVNSAVHDIRWSFNIDTTVLPDGKMTLHYIVEDSAGNRSYYNQEISVRNKYPQIDRVTLITDNNGIGAVYTTHPDPNASTEYVLNDFRNRMFANYTDTKDNQYLTSLGSLDPNQNNPAAASRRRSDSLGYLNSGFISKNQYIGFKLETLYGNRDLNFRLQHVTRQRIVLNKTNLQNMVEDRKLKDPAKINLYTIAWHGDYSNAKWKALGVPVDNPMLGTHFVLQLDEVPADYVDSTAEVWKYTQVASVRRNDVTPTGQPEDGVLVFGPDSRFGFNGSAHFNTNPALGIGEYNGSHPDLDEQDKNNPRETAFFLIRVWDTVNPPANNSSEEWVNDQLYDAVVIGMNVYLSDKINPTARLYDPNPYAETAVVGNNITTANQEQTIRNALDPRGIGQNILRGGLYNVKTERELVKSGHIEPRSGTGALNPRVKNPVTRVYEPLIADGFVEGDSAANTFVGGASVTRDLVSGKIIIRGSAWDDQLIREIRVHIGTGATPSADLYDPSSAMGQNMAILKLDLTTRTMQPVNGAKAWAAEELHWKTGHTVEWAYVWDTESIPTPSGTPAENVRVWVAVIDQLGSSEAGLASSNNTTENEATDTFRNTLTFDIVPYITGIERDTSKFTTTRSLQGWYSFYQGEVGVSLVGYNLKGSGNSAITIRHGASATTAPTITGEQKINRITFTVPDNAQSGKIILNTSAAVGGSTEALNHRSNDRQSWNRESHFYTEGSDLWINKPYAHIWRTADSDTAPRTYMGSKTVNDNSGSEGLDHPGMALEYAGTDSGRLHGVWAVYGYANVFYGTNNGTNNKLEPGQTGTPSVPGDPYATPDISILNGGGRTAANAGYSYQGDGDAYLRVKAVVNTASAGNTIEPTATNNPTQRWQNVRIAKARANSSDAETNVGRIYMTAFDARNNGLWYGSRGGANADGTGTQSNTAMFIDGGNANIPAASGLAAVASAGQFSAVDYDSTGPIIAYYDQTNDTVRLALGLATVPGTGANQWNRKYLLASSHPLYRGSGRYISIKVDKDNRIHLAFFNSTRSTVVYAVAASRNADFTAYAIDDVVKGGTWTDISVDNNGNPWIVYGDSSRTGNYDGARMAYRSGSTTGIQFVRDKKDPVTGAVDIKGWEAVSMPANYKVNNDRLNIEAWPPTVRGGTLGAAPGWNAAVGYASDMYRIGYFYYPAYKDGNY